MKTFAALLSGWIVAVLPGLAAEPWTLERALTEGLARNPDAKLAEQRIIAARAELEQVNAAFWPKLQFQSSYTRTDNPMQVFGSILNQRAYSSSLDFNDVPDTDDLNVKGLLTVPLYAGGRNQAARQAAKASAQAARYENEAVRNALGFEIVRAFHHVLKAREFIYAAEAGVNAFEQSLTVGQKRLEGGSILRTEVLDIQVRLAQAREDLIRSRNAQSLAQRALRNLIGIEQGEFEVAQTAPSASVPDGGDYAGRFELKAAQQREHAAQDELRAAKSGYLPRVSAFGSMDYEYGWRFNNGGRSYTGGALVQWDIWDGRLTRAKTRQAEAGVAMAREQERKVRLALDFEAEQARLELNTASERLKVTGEAVEQARQSAELTRSRFEQGLALSTQLIDAETALVAARVRRAEAEADHRIAVASLRKALGIRQLDLPDNPMNR